MSYVAQYDVIDRNSNGDQNFGVFTLFDASKLATSDSGMRTRKNACVEVELHKPYKLLKLLELQARASAPNAISLRNAQQQGSSGLHP